jgi:hypothetical protein
VKQWFYSFVRQRTLRPAQNGPLWRSFLLCGILLTLPGTAAAAALQLNWQDQSTNESGFKIERLNGSSYAPIATVAANVKTYMDGNVTAGVSYCYRVRAFNSTGESASTEAVCTTAPAAPAPTIPTEPAPTPTLPSSPTPTPTPTPVLPTASMSWNDYAVSMKIRSDDNDGIGVLLRYQDENNYYRFSWFAEGKIRRLEKRINGAFHLLAKENSAYTVGKSYNLQISMSGPVIKVAIDGKVVFSVKDSSLAHGTIALYSFYNRGSHFDDIVVQDLTGNTLVADDFNDGDSIGWTMIDEGNDAGPSKWSVLNGALAQTSDIGSSMQNGKLGTVALYTRGSWADYRMTVKLRSSDDDFIGVMFRVQDNDNYYRLSWEKGTPGRRLWKRENGVFKLLAEDGVGYNINQTYAIEIIVQGSALKIKIDGQSVFSISDAAFKSGTIALYSAFNQNSYFEDVVVEDLASKAVLLSDNFNDGNLTGWKPIDEAGTTAGPSVWSVASGALIQSSNIGSDAPGRPGTFLLY